MNRKISLMSILTAALYVVSGLILVFSPGQSARFLCRMIGWIALISGVVHVLEYAFSGSGSLLYKAGMTRGLIDVAVGLILLILTNALLSLISIVIGVYVIVACVFVLQSAIDMKSLGHPFWWLNMLSAVIGIVFGAIMLFNYQGATKLIIVLSGIALLIYGIEQLFTLIVTSNK